MKQLGRNMLRRRQELGLTPRRAAEGADMSPDYWKRIEGGYMDPSVAELENIANVLRVRPDILAGWHRKGVGIVARLEKEGENRRLFIEWDDDYELTLCDVSVVAKGAELLFERAET